MRSKVVVVGSYNVDIIIKADRLPGIGETVLGNGITFCHGGKGANQAVAAARAGAEVALLARVGADSYGESIIADLAKEGISTNAVKMDPEAPTGMASITVDRHGENCIVAVSGANARLNSQDIQESKDLIAAADFLLVQLETPLETVESAIRLAYENNTVVILDPAPAQRLKPEILRQISVITPNESEARLLTGITITDEESMEKAASALLAMGIKVVLITQGDKGVYIAAKNLRKLIPACSVTAVDSTGAGDVFNGYLATYLDVNLVSLPEAVSYAVAASALSVTRPGTQPAIPYAEEVAIFLKTLHR